ncbi:ABC transporter ATP-binding protein [Candidatus Parcubacteria bacterium]|nr:ABC transporter ATP-binding protein [Candidatus Parcubacteria bacterium]
MELALSVKNLKKTYANGVHALDGVSLDIPKGDFFALLGPNGAGKTTLIGIVTGLVTKSEGKVSVFGTDIDQSPEKAKTYIGVVPQEINVDFFGKPLDILVNVAGYYGIPRSVAVPRAEDLLRRLDLYEKRNMPFMTLSGGMKRRLMVARALIHKPQFLILDEPTAGVDIELRRGMWEFLKSLTREGVTILLTTHYLEEAEQLCKHVAIVHKGKFIASGTMKDVLGRLKTERVFLDLVKPIGKERIASISALGPYHPHQTDETTLEIELGEGRALSGAVMALEREGFPVQTVRPKSGRLEEVFMHLTKDPA